MTHSGHQDANAAPEKHCQNSAQGQACTLRKPRRPLHVMSALPPTTNIRRCRRDVRKVPVADISTLSWPTLFTRWIPGGNS